MDYDLRVIVIRHTNKSPTSGRNASPEGYIRANKIVSFFKGYLGDSITALFASNYGYTCLDRSKREYELLVPTSQTYHIPIEMPYCISEYSILAKHILSLKGTIVVAWEHHHIPLLLRDLYVRPEPSPWPKNAGNRYDLVFDVKIKKIGDKFITSMFVTTEGLGLPGDSLSIPKEYEMYNGTNFNVIKVGLDNYHSKVDNTNNCAIS